MITAISTSASPVKSESTLEAQWWGHVFSGCPGNFEVITGDGPLPMAIFELLEYIVNEVTS